jgi:hypothetical protein
LKNDQQALQIFPAVIWEKESTVACSWSNDFHVWYDQHQNQ